MEIRTPFVFIVFVVLLTGSPADSQDLKPGFDKAEYRELMYVSARTCALAPSYYSDLPAPARFRMVYRAEVAGLDNLWDLWTDGAATAVVSIRGTTEKAESWLANFYAAMVPAKGELKLNSHETFSYELASDPKAAVHVGWLLSTAYLSKDMLPRLDSCYKSGIRNVFIVGHSQGGAISYLVTSHFRHLQKSGRLPSDLRFKTYCSAAPKPGNLYYAYTFEAETYGGWAYNVVNTADWVPETPISIQTIADFNVTNPFTNAGAMIRKQKFPRNMILKRIYRRLDRPTRKAQKRYERYLGKMTSRLVRKSIREFTAPVYYKSNNYTRTGVFVVLPADEVYYTKYTDNPATVFVHHSHQAYLYLLDKLGDTVQ